MVRLLSDVPVINFALQPSIHIDHHVLRAYSREYFGKGRAITEAIIRMGGYQSISGNFIRIDENGDSEGNFTAYALKEHNYTYVSRISGAVKFSCNHYPVKVTMFF